MRLLIFPSVLFYAGFRLAFLRLEAMPILLRMVAEMRYGLKRFGKAVSGPGSDPHSARGKLD